MAANGATDDEGSQITWVASKTERLTFCWPISDWSERTEPAKTRSYHFMEDNPVSKITWRLELSPCDNVHGCDVVSAALFLNYSGTSQARDYKVMVTLSLRDVQGGQNYTHSSCVYYLTREGPPDGANPSYRVNICTRQELLSHHLNLLPDNTLTLLANMTFVQEESNQTQVQADIFPAGTNSLSSDLSNAFKSSDFTDMTIVADKREFHCHKFMLAARSEVFAAMLRHEFLEKQNSRVDVKEIDGETMELLLNYIYTGRVSDFKSVSVVDLFKAADRYRLDHLKQMCEEELVNRVEASNAADILSLAHKYNAAPLKSFALAMISRNVDQVKRTNGWREVILNDQGLLIEAFDSLASYNEELKNKLVDNNP